MSENEEVKTPREELEEDVIRISEPGRRKIMVSLPDGSDYSFGIIPLTFTDLKHGEDHIRKIINEFKLLSGNVDEFRDVYLKLTSVNRSIQTEGAEQSASPNIDEAWDAMVKKLFNPDMPIEIKNHVESIFKSIIKIGSDADYEKIERFSIWTVVRIVKAIIAHNYTDRLKDFYLGELQ